MKFDTLAFEKDPMLSLQKQSSAKFYSAPHFNLFRNKKSAFRISTESTFGFECKF